jgi:hypothetical protein
MNDTNQNLCRKKSLGTIQRSYKILLNQMTYIEDFSKDLCSRIPYLY